MIEQIKRHLLDEDVFTDPGFRLAVLRRSPQIPFPKHTHDFAELVIVYGGKGTHFTESEEYTVNSGDVFILTGDRAHGYRNPENLQLVNVIFTRQVLQTPPFQGFDLDSISGYHALFTWEPRLRTEHRFENRLRLEPPELARAVSFVEKLETELSGRQPGYKAMAYAQFIELCGFLSRRYETSSSPKMKELSRISSVLNLMENNCSRIITISELTEVGGMSESTLLRIFHRTTGLSPVEYHNRLKIERICRMLDKTDKSITEIAYDMGFSDSNYMTRLFKKVTGVPPGQWRKKSAI